VQGLEERAAKLDREIAHTHKRAKELEAQVGAPFEHDERYHAPTRRQQEIADRLDLTRNQAPSASDSEIAGTQKASVLDGVTTHSRDAEETTRQIQHRRRVRL